MAESTTAGTETGWMREVVIEWTERANKRFEGRIIGIREISALISEVVAEVARRVRVADAELRTKQDKASKER